MMDYIVSTVCKLKPCQKIKWEDRTKSYLGSRSVPELGSGSVMTEKNP